jgi:hypothetical protein
VDGSRRPGPHGRVFSCVTSEVRYEGCPYEGCVISSGFTHSSNCWFASRPRFPEDYCYTTAATGRAFASATRRSMTLAM